MENSTWYPPRRSVLFCLAQVEFLNAFPIQRQKERTALTQAWNTVAKSSLETSSHSKSKRLNCKYCILPLSLVESVICVLVCLYVLLRKIPRTAMVMPLWKGEEHRHVDCVSAVGDTKWLFWRHQVFRMGFSCWLINFKKNLNNSVWFTAS